MMKNSTDSTKLFYSFPCFCVLSFYALIVIAAFIGTLFGLATMFTWQQVSLVLWLCFMYYLFALPAADQKRIQDYWLIDIWKR